VNILWSQTTAYLTDTTRYSSWITGLYFVLNWSKNWKDWQQWKVLHHIYVYNIFYWTNAQRPKSILAPWEFLCSHELVLGSFSSPLMTTQEGPSLFTAIDLLGPAIGWSILSKSITWFWVFFSSTWWSTWWVYLMGVCIQRWSVSLACEWEISWSMKPSQFSAVPLGAATLGHIFAMVGHQNLSWLSFVKNEQTLLFLHWFDCNWGICRVEGWPQPNEEIRSSWTSSLSWKILQNCKDA